MYSTYHASFWRLERNSVHGLPSNPVPVPNVDGAEKLELHIHFRHVFQPLERPLKVFGAELLVTETGRKTPNQLPNFRLISTKFRLIFCLIADKLPNSQSRFFRLGDTPRDRPATPEMAALRQSAKNPSQIRRKIRRKIRQKLGETLGGKLGETLGRT